MRTVLPKKFQLKTIMIMPAVAVFVILFLAFLVYGPTKAEKQEREFKSDFKRATLNERRAVFEKHIAVLGSAKILNTLETMYPICHSEAHDLGKVILAQTNDIERALDQCRDSCGDGCFHGVLMETFKDFISDDKRFDGHLVLENLKGTVAKVCDNPTLKSIHRIGNCAHGVGHAFEYLANYDIAKGLEYCKLFPERPMQYYCSSGVFMERDLQYGIKDAQNKDLHFPCSKYGDEFPAACYRYKAPRMMLSLISPNNLADKCIKLDGFRRLGCFHGLGFAYNTTIAQKPETIKNVCAYGNYEDKTMCVDGATIKFTDERSEIDYNICSYLPYELKNECLKLVKLGSYNTTEKSFALYFPD